MNASPLIPGLSIFFCVNGDGFSWLRIDSNGGLL
jgi:hypothetical protein